MPLFIDTCKIAEIERFHRMGVIRGVTTNPTIMCKDGLTGGLPAIQRAATQIAELVSPHPVFVELFSNEREAMLRQACEFASWAPNVQVKVPIHGPNGELDNLEVVNQLESAFDVRVNVTAIMSAQQCLAAALAGASYVSLFGGRMNNMGYDSTAEFGKARRLLELHGLQARIIAASTREVLNIAEWLHAGAHIVTVSPSLLEGMIVHPYSTETVRMFLNDARRLLHGQGEQPVLRRAA